MKGIEMINKSIIYYEAIIEELNGIEFYVKVNGKPFKSSNKWANKAIYFDGVIRPEQKLQLKDKNWVSLSHILVKQDNGYYDEEFDRYIPADRVLGGGCIKYYYHLNFEEMQEAIILEKEKYQSYLEKELNNKAEFQKFLAVLDKLTVPEIKEYLDGIDYWNISLKMAIKTEIKEFLGIV